MNKLNVPQPRVNYYKNSFSYSGAVLLELRKAESINQFKLLIKEVIWSITLNKAFMESSFDFMIFEKIVNVVHIVLSMLGFKFLLHIWFLYC